VGALLKVAVIDAARGPTALGVNVIWMVQPVRLGMETPLAHVPSRLKSPVFAPPTEIVLIVRGELLARLAKVTGAVEDWPTTVAFAEKLVGINTAGGFPPPPLPVPPALAAIASAKAIRHTYTARRGRGSFMGLLLHGNRFGAFPKAAGNDADISEGLCQ
jgi:hypothetical protein